MDLITILRNSSKACKSITIQGFFDLPLNDVEYLVNNWVNSDLNPLDCVYYYMAYDNYNGEIDDIYYDEVLKHVYELLQVNYISKDDFNKFRWHLKSCRIKHTVFSEYENRRKEADRVLANTAIRQKVFEMHGDKCLCCGSQDNVQIDHVISVWNGGENDLDNFQPLCKSCNVKKGTKTIDYRKND